MTDAHASPLAIASKPEELIRLGYMARGLLDELRAAPLDDVGFAQVGRVYERTVAEITKILAPDLRAELLRLTTLPHNGAASPSEVRLCQAQLVGWIQGLFNGIQVALSS